MAKRSLLTDARRAVATTPNQRRHENADWDEEDA